MWACIIFNIKSKSWGKIYTVIKHLKEKNEERMWKENKKCETKTKWRERKMKNKWMKTQRKEKKKNDLKN